MQASYILDHCKRCTLRVVKCIDAFHIGLLSHNTTKTSQRLPAIKRGAVVLVWILYLVLQSKQWEWQMNGFSKKQRCQVCRTHIASLYCPNHERLLLRDCNWSNSRLKMHLGRYDTSTGIDNKGLSFVLQTFHSLYPCALPLGHKPWSSFSECCV